MATGLKIRDAMISPVITEKPDQTILEASKKMKKNGVGSLIIVENSRVVGIVTREDIVNKVAAKNLLPESVLVKDIQSTSLITCSPEHDISEAAVLMSRYKFERIPVVSNGKLVGIISAREIAKVAPPMLEIATEHLRLNDVPEIRSEENTGDCQVCGNFAENLHYINDEWICDSCREESQGI